jgi:hypothetical protein
MIFSRKLKTSAPKGPHPRYETHLIVVIYCFLQKVSSIMRSFTYHSYEQSHHCYIFWRGINNHSLLYHLANWSLIIIFMTTIIPNDHKLGELTQPSNTRLTHASFKAPDTTNAHIVLLLSRPWNADASTAHTLAQALNLHHLPPPRSLISPPLQGFNNTKYLLPPAHQPTISIA